jgi:type IV pilus assembly protein PilO
MNIFNQFKDLNPNDVGTWPLIPKIASYFGIFLLINVLGGFAYIYPKMDELNSKSNEEEKLKEEFKQKLEKAISLDVLKTQKDQVAQYVALIEKQLPNKAEIDALLSDINQAGLARGLQFDLFKPGQIQVTKYYAELPINVRVTGSYNDIAHFVSDVANLSRIVTVGNMNVSWQKDNHQILTFDAIAKTYRYLDRDELNVQNKTDAKNKPKDNS